MLELLFGFSILILELIFWISRWYDFPIWFLCCLQGYLLTKCQFFQVCLSLFFSFLLSILYMTTQKQTNGNKYNNKKNLRTQTENLNKDFFSHIMTNIRCFIWHLFSFSLLQMPDHSSNGNNTMNTIYRVSPMCQVLYKRYFAFWILTIFSPILQMMKSKS